MYHSLTATLRCDRCADKFEVEIEVADACTSGDDLIDRTMQNNEGDLHGQAMGSGEHACPKCYSMVLAAYDDRMDSE